MAKDEKEEAYVVSKPFLSVAVENLIINRYTVSF